MVVAWGYGSLYNHSNTPNADWLDIENDMAFKFIAIKSIQPEEEICINYGSSGYWNDGRKDIKIVD
jgi:SET domain-containing protein